MSLFSRFRRSSAERVASIAQIPAGIRVYAIGDVHGRDDLFSDLLDKIEADHQSRTSAQSVLILLGDLIDRGPDSRAVVERA
jgi:serine/threonine protein phosphatase 1